MTLKFEKFVNVGSRFSPSVSIRSNGSIGLSQGAIRRFKLGEEYAELVLYYDREASTVGIKPVKEGEDEHTLKINIRTMQGKRGKQTKTAFVSAKSFLDFYGIGYKETRSFPAEWSDEHGMIIVKLGESKGGQ